MLFGKFAGWNPKLPLPLVWAWNPWTDVGLDAVSQVHRTGGVEHFIVHARKAILGGLSPEENRTIPPLRHDYVYRLVRDFPRLDFTLNGGVTTYEEVLLSWISLLRHL